LKPGWAAVGLVLVLALAAGGARAADYGRLAFGTLPVIQALPLFVAQEKGLFEEEGVAVKLIPFRQALEKDVAMKTGQIDGYFGDLFTPIILAAGGTPIKIAAVNYRTGPYRRMFGILASPGSGIQGAADLAGVPVAVSTGTIIEYVTTTLLEQNEVEPDQIRLLETKSIPIRLQMLLSGQVKAATLPEPLVTLATVKGARLLADDAGSDLSSTVLVFSEAVLEKRPGDVRAFLRACQRAADLINADAEGVRAIMNQHCNVPRPLQSEFPVPQFPALAAPPEDRVLDAVDWLAAQGRIKSRPAPEQLVDVRFLP
jgi:NitT/TauT family transport system substrate-binding protein